MKPCTTSLLQDPTMWQSRARNGASLGTGLFRPVRTLNKKSFRRTFSLLRCSWDYKYWKQIFVFFLFCCHVWTDIYIENKKQQFVAKLKRKKWCELVYENSCKMHKILMFKHMMPIGLSLWFLYYSTLSKTLNYKTLIKWYWIAIINEEYLSPG